MLDFIESTLLSVPAVLIAFIVQGYGKALVADRLGDKTPRFQGRLSLNPTAHIDPIGFLLILICGFGWTKPVETNPSAYKRGYKDSIKVALAGPIANLITAFVFAFVSVIWVNTAYIIFPSVIVRLFIKIFYLVCAININLFIFNLIPIPGLAGFEIFKAVSPKNFYKYAGKLYEYQMIILLGVVLLAQYILSIPSGLIYKLFINIAYLVVGIFFN
ncbi:site-2 protease family protein [Clostridium sartagoforme]|uniref:Site-2 protease family protein n=2 Tax=Clostridium TaxID=1485 RepID=A0A4S2DMR8_9CLOT|nr:site-2 protease family protein [Clostridium sartagoforme]TGY43365.1 site-2 protease family protein [Clostridium sartagoforme]